jgi:hypothetical protein
MKLQKQLVKDRMKLENTWVSMKRRAAAVHLLASKSGGLLAGIPTINERYRRW